MFPLSMAADKAGVCPPACNARILRECQRSDLTDDKLATLVAAARKVIAEDKFPRSPRLDPLKSALAKLDPASVPRPLPERVPPPEAPARHRGGRRARR
jgi:hypothetical protein